MAKETKYAAYLRERIDRCIAQSEEHSKQADALIEQANTSVDDAVVKIIKSANADYAKALDQERRANKKLRKALDNLYKLGLHDGETAVLTEDNKASNNSTRLLQAFSYTVFDTILFSITRGAAPDFLLISQSALFDTVYVNISRGFESYLFHDVPQAAVAVVHQGRAILNELREREDRFLDEKDLWDVYAPDIQQWWINTALPLIFGERDPDWDNVALPTRDEMVLWTESEFSQRKHFPAVADLVEIAKEHAVDVSNTFNFKSILSV